MKNLFLNKLHVILKLVCRKSAEIFNLLNYVRILAIENVFN